MDNFKKIKYSNGQNRKNETFYPLTLKIQNVHNHEIPFKPKKETALTFKVPLPLNIYVNIIKKNFYKR